MACTGMATATQRIIFAESARTASLVLYSIGMALEHASSSDPKKIPVAAENATSFQQ